MNSPTPEDVTPPPAPIRGRDHAHATALDRDECLRGIRASTIVWRTIDGDRVFSPTPPADALPEPDPAHNTRREYRERMAAWLAPYLPATPTITHAAECSADATCIPWCSCICHAKRSGVALIR